MKIQILNFTTSIRDRLTQWPRLLRFLRDLGRFLRPMLLLTAVLILGDAAFADQFPPPGESASAPAFSESLGGYEQKKIGRTINAGIFAMDAMSRSLAEPIGREPLLSHDNRSWDIDLYTPTGYDRIQASALQPSLKVDTSLLALGFRRILNNNGSLVVVAGYLSQNGRIDDRGLRFDQDGFITSVSNSVAVGPITLSGEATYAWLNLKTRRNPGQTPALTDFAARGKTKPNLSRATLQASYLLGPVERWNIVFETGATFTESIANGFTESGDLGNALKYSKIRYGPVVGYGGANLRAETLQAAPWLQVRPELRLKVETEFADRDITVNAGSIDSTSPATAGILSLGNRWRFSAEPRLLLAIKQHAEATFSYRYETAGHGLKQHSIWFTLSQRF